MGGGASDDPGAPRSTAAQVAIAIAAVGLFAGFIALGTWQMHRRTWKLALIARIEQRVHAAPVAPPAPQDWPQVGAERDEYRRVRISGTLLRDRETLVRAAAALGSGYWVLTPLAAADGTIVLVNRGFVPPGWRERADPANGAPGDTVTVTGLLRISEPGGAFLRRNDPAAGRWYSSDVAAIAAARGLTRVAPYFIDAEAPSSTLRAEEGNPAEAAQGGESGTSALAPQRGGEAEPDEPVAGLTMIKFYNNHLVYAITWYALAVMLAVAVARVALAARRTRRSR